MSDLKEWTWAFVKYKSMMQKGVVGLEDLGKEIVLVKNDSKRVYEIKEELSPSDKQGSTIVTYNTQKNVASLLKDWKVYVTNSTTVFFVNTKESMHWAINAKYHSYAADTKKLGKGINSLFESVPSQK